MSKINNFYCPNCNEESIIPSYTLTIKGEYKYKGTSKVICCKNEECINNGPFALLPIPKEFTGVPNFGKFASMTPTQKQEVLKQRAKKHAYSHHNPLDIKQK